VPQDLIEEFAEAIENDLNNHIVEATPDSEIKISIDYDTARENTVICVFV
jgi:predicted nucleotidyltransferase